MEEETSTFKVLVRAGSLLVAGLESALIGYSERRGVIVAVYNLDECLELLNEDESLSYEETLQWFYGNIHSKDFGEDTPIFVRLDYNI